MESLFGDDDGQITSNTPNDDESLESVSSSASVWRKGLRRRRNNLRSNGNNNSTSNRRVKRRLSTGSQAFSSPSSSSRSQLSALDGNHASSNSNPLLDSAVSASCWSTTTTQFAGVTRNVENKQDNIPQSTTPKASGKGAGRTSTLFSSVMQNVGGSRQDKLSALDDDPQHSMTTPTKQQRPSAFSPTQRNNGPLPFGSPGGFQLLDFVHNVASPSSNLQLFPDSPQAKGGSSTSPRKQPKEWHETYINATSDLGVIDWSVHDKVQFQCHPASVVTSLVQQSLYPNPLGLTRFLQPERNENTTMTDRAHLGAAQWGSGLSYWQHPAIYPCPFSTKAMSSRRRKSAAAATTTNIEDDKISGKNLFARNDPHNTNKARKLDLSKQRLPLGELENNGLLTAAQQQQRVAQFRKHRRHAWQQAFRSLFWKWMEQVQCLQTQGHDAVTYFYALGQDHAILFHVGNSRDSSHQDTADEQESGGSDNGHKNNNKASTCIVPKIIISSSSAPFREKLRQTDVKCFRLLQNWSDFPRDTIFREEMIMEPSPTVATADAESKQAPKAASGQPADQEVECTIPGTPSKSNAGAPANFNSTGKISSGHMSPKVEAELAALRRAQATGETVGADVTISFKSANDTGASKTRRLRLSSIPPLYVSGWEDCTAFFEVYLNLTSSCVQSVIQPPPLSQFAKKEEPEMNKGAKTNEKTNQGQKSSSSKLQLPDDVPLLLCRKLGPFKHASLQYLEVQGDLHHPSQHAHQNAESNNYASVEVVGGPLLPCAVRELVLGLVNTMIVDKYREDSEKSKHNGGNESADEDSGDEFDQEDTVVGTHNLILTAYPMTDNNDRDEDWLSSGRFSDLIIGKPGSLAFNHAPPEHQEGDASAAKPDGVSQPACEIPNGKILNMAVWDINHPNAIAYKAEPAAANTTTFSLL